MHRCALFIAVALFVTIGACQSPSQREYESSHSSVIELGRVHWQIGDLDALTVLSLEDGVPAHQTTVTNSNETDRWWTGLDVYGYSTFGSSTDPENPGGWGAAGGQACTISSALPEIRSGSVKMTPGETRSYHGLHPNFPTSPKRETVTTWSLKGKLSLPSRETFADWPPFQARFNLKWDDEEGCSVEQSFIHGSVRGEVVLEGTVPKPIRAPLDQAMQEATGLSEYVSERWLVGEDGGLANCAVSLKPIDGTEAPPIEPLEDVYFDKVGPFFRPQVLVVPCGTSVTLRNQESPCRGFHGRAKKNRSFNRSIRPGEEHAWLAERAEVVGVGCDVRPYVHGTIVIVDTPYYAKTDAEGKFNIRDVAPGTYTLRAFHEGLGRWIKGQRVIVPDWGASVSLELRASADD